MTLLEFTLLGFSDETALLIAIVLVGVVLSIYYFFIRWVFSVEKILENQKNQTRVLLKIAEKLGANNDDELSNIKEMLK